MLESQRISRVADFASYELLSFKRFGREEYDLYKSCYSSIEPASDFSLNNVIVWLDINDDLHLAKDRHNLVLRYSCPFLGDRTVFSIIGVDDPGSTIQRVFDYQEASDLPCELIMIPQTVVKSIGKEDLEKLGVVEDEENFDYIYDVSDKADLTTPHAGKFRRTINRFIRDYGDDVTIREVDLMDPTEVHRLVNALHIWKSGSVVSNNDKLNIEGVAIDRYLNHRDELHPHCLEVYVNNVLISFSIYHYPPQEGYAIINHIKCNYQYRNVFDFTFFCIMSRLKMDGIVLANGEQDLGIPGIREYKHKLGPVAYIKRYTVRPSTA